MKYRLVLLIALTLGACTDQDTVVGRSNAAQAAATTMPPNLRGDCASYALLDEKCTKDWYQCTGSPGEHGSCSKAWDQCCSLPGGTQRMESLGQTSVSHY